MSNTKVTITIRDSEVEQVIEFMYLGSILTTDGKCDGGNEQAAQAENRIKLIQCSKWLMWQKNKETIVNTVGFAQYARYVVQEFYEPG